MTKREQIATDGRVRGDYESRYLDDKIKRRIRWEACYITFLLLSALVGLFLNFLGVFEQYFSLTGDKAIIFHKALYCVLSGLLGGSNIRDEIFLPCGGKRSVEQGSRILEIIFAADCCIIVGCHVCNYDKGYFIIQFYGNYDRIFDGIFLR